MRARTRAVPPCPREFPDPSFQHPRRNREVPLRFLPSPVGPRLPRRHRPPPLPGTDRSPRVPGWPPREPLLPAGLPRSIPPVPIRPPISPGLLSGTLLPGIRWLGNRFRDRFFQKPVRAPGFRPALPLPPPPALYREAGVFRRLRASIPAPRRPTHPGWPGDWVLLLR